MSADISLLVVGGGPAGVTAALQASELGGQVTLLEAGQVGGTSLNRGPAPVRTLARAARLARDWSSWATFGLTGPAPVPDLAAVMANSDRVARYAHDKKDVAGHLRRRAAGDVNGRWMVVQTARMEGRIAAMNAILGPTRRAIYDVVPSGSFTDPEYGRVGLTDAQAAKGHDVVVGIARYDDLLRPVADGRPDGFCKLIADRGTHAILGGHVLGGTRPRPCRPSPRAWPAP